MATPEEQAIQGVIDQIWDTYDVDKSGALDKEETKKFVQDTLGNLGSGDEFSQEAFDEVFQTFDKDNSGTVEKAEMVVFIKQLLGGNWASRACHYKLEDERLEQGLKLLLGNFTGWCWLHVSLLWQPNVRALLLNMKF